MMMLLVVAVLMMTLGHECKLPYNDITRTRTSVGEVIVQQVLKSTQHKHKQRR